MHVALNRTIANTGIQVVNSVNAQVTQTETNVNNHTTNTFQSYFGPGPSGDTRENVQERLRANQNNVRRLQTQNSEFRKALMTDKKRKLAEQKEQEKAEQKEAKKREKAEQKEAKKQRNNEPVLSEAADASEHASDLGSDGADPVVDNAHVLVESTNAEIPDESINVTTAEEAESFYGSDGEDPIVTNAEHTNAEHTKSKYGIDITEYLKARMRGESVEEPVEKAEEPVGKLMNIALSFPHGGHGEIKIVNGKHFCDVCKGVIHPCKFRNCVNT
jgi:hypothetical protein